MEIAHVCILTKYKNTYRMSNVKGPTLNKHYTI